MNSINYSILIPTWNNFAYLKLCIESLDNYKHQILVFVNEADPETIDFLKLKNIKHLSSPQNKGICFALNELAKLATNDFLVYMNDDMVALPGWDKAFQETIISFKDDRFFVSSSLIEPRPSKNPNYPIIVADYGTSPQNFKFNEISDDLETLKKGNWNGASWPVSLVSKKLWNEVGGYSMEFSPGMYSDPDFSMKLWQHGIRNFIGLGNCLFYHFGSVSTKRIKHNKASVLFLKKWGMSAKVFYSHFLKMGSLHKGALVDTKLPLSKKIQYSIKRVLSF